MFLGYFEVGARLYEVSMHSTLHYIVVLMRHWRLVRVRENAPSFSEHSSADTGRKII